MRLALITLHVFALVACGGGTQSASPEAAQPSEPSAGSEPPSPPPAAGTAEAAPGDSQSFALRTSEKSSSAEHHPSALTPTASEAAVHFTVIDKDKGPIPGIVVVLTAPDGRKYYTEATDPTGFAEVLVPIGRRYELIFLSLGRSQVAANVDVPDEPNQNIRLKLRYKRIDPPKGPEGDPNPHGFVLSGVTFDTGKAKIRPESFPQLDGVVDYLKHNKTARIEISGHTDNVGNPKGNKALSKRRAEACRKYLIDKGIEPSRIDAVGYGDERPIASNDSELGRQENRRIEAIEL